MAKRMGMWVIILAVLAAPATASAASSWAQESGWGNQAKAKLVYGLKNTLLGWTEIFTEPKEALDGGTNFFVGVGTGLWNGVGQTLGGALHLVTFPITQIDIPLPEGGTELLK